MKEQDLDKKLKGNPHGIIQEAIAQLKEMHKSGGNMALLATEVGTANIINLCEYEKYITGKEARKYRDDVMRIGLK